MALKKSTKGNESLTRAEFTNRWNKFGETLRWEDQLVWDEMFSAKEIHEKAIHAQPGTEFEKSVMSMLVEQWKIEDDMEKRISRMERRVK